MTAILLKYVNSRALFASLQNSTRSHGTSGHTGSAPSTRPQRNRNRIRIDKWIIFRFSAAFIILSIFMICIVVFQAVRYTGSKQLARTQSPDYSADGGVSDVMQFIPGVTSALLGFLLFGTTAQHRAKYLEWLRDLRCGASRRQRRRPSLDGGGGGERATAPMRRRSKNTWDYLPDDAGAPAYECTIEGGRGEREAVEMGFPRHQRRDDDDDDGRKLGAVNVSEEITVDNGVERASRWDFGFEQLSNQDDMRPLAGRGG